MQVGVGLIYQQHVRRKTVRTAIWTQGSAFIRLDVSVRPAQISRQVWHRVRKLEAVWIRGAAQPNHKKPKKLAKPQLGGLAQAATCTV